MFGLKQGYLTPKPREGAYTFVGPKRKWAEDFISHVRRVITSGRPPKAVVFGAMGIGKTHFTTLVSHELADVARVVYVETPPMHRRSKFNDLHKAIMKKIGREYSVGLLELALKQANKQSTPLHEALGIDADLATVVRNGLSSDKSVLWRYLSGEKLSSGELRQIDAVSPQMSEDDAVSVINMIAKLVRTLEKKQFIVIIDEFENTTFLMGDSMAAFREGIRGLVDESNQAGIIISNSARETEEMPLPITDESVQRRIGFANYRLFPEYNQEELVQLIYELIDVRREKGIDIKKLVGKDRESRKEAVSGRSYPFSEEAIKEAVDTVIELRQLGRINSTRPKEALDVLDLGLSVATQESAAVVVSEHIRTAKQRYPLTPRPRE